MNSPDREQLGKGAREPAGAANSRLRITSTPRARAGQRGEGEGGSATSGAAPTRQPGPATRDGGAMNGDETRRSRKYVPMMHH